MQYVIRMENSEGEGPYGYAQNWKAGPHLASNGRPCPSDHHLDQCKVDAMKAAYGSGNVLFGFSDMEQALAWFWPEERAALEPQGFIFREVAAKEVLEITNQVIFVRAKC